MSRKLKSKVRRRFDQLYDDLVKEGFDKDEIEELPNESEDDLLQELDDIESE